MSDVLDVVTQLTYEANTNALEGVNKLFGSQFQQLKDLQAEQAKLNALQSSTNSVKVTEQLNQKLAENKRRIDDITTSIGKEFSANEKLVGSLKKSKSQYDSIGVSISRIAQDAPFGFIGIANNITPAFDAIIGKVNQLKAEGAGTGKIFSEIGSSLFSFTSIVGIAIGVLTIFGDQLFKVGKNAKAAADDYQKFVDAINQDINSTLSNIDKQSNKVNILLDVIQKGGKGAAGAIKELRDTYPSLFTNLTDADILAGKGIDRLKEQIGLSEKAKLAETSLLKFQKEKRDADKELTEATEKNTAAQLKLNQAQFVYRNALPDQINQARTALDIAKRSANEASIALTTAQGRVRGLANEISLAQSQAASLISQAPDLSFKQDKPGKEKKVDPLEAAKQADRDLQDFQRMKTAIYDKYREFVRQDILTGNELTKAEEAGREANLNNEIKIIDNFIAQRTNLLEQSLAKSKADLLKLQTEEAELKLQYLQLINVIPSLSQAGNTGIQSPTFRQRFNKNPIKDIQKDDDEAANQRLKNIKLLTDAYVTLAETAINALNQINETEIRNLDREIALREKSVENAEQLAERGNTEVLRLERERLEAATKEREEAAQRQIELNSLLQASNAAVALTDALLVVTNAGKTGDPYTTAARIAAAVAALAAGFTLVSSLVAASKATASGFKDGGYTGDGNVNDTAGVVHKKEFVMPAKITADKHNRKILDAMYKGEPLPVMKVPAHMGGFANRNELKSVERKLDKVVTAIEGSRLKQDIHFDEHGVGVMTVKSVTRENNKWR